MRNNFTLHIYKEAEEFFYETISQINGVAADGGYAYDIYTKLFAFGECSGKSD